LDLLPFLKEEVQILKRTIPESIQIRLDFEPLEYLINADVAQLQQVLTNLAVNARDAMPSGGRLDLALSHLRLEPGAPLPLPELTSGDWVVLVVSDTGVGIPAEVLCHIYEPFFTTKAVGQGSGLGLSQVYGIVKQHKGLIDVASWPGQGTAFTIYFPAVAALALTTADPGSNDLPIGNQETILLVEDDPAVLMVSREMLGELNYRVVTATNGIEALAACANTPDPINLVISDIIMADMDGLALLKALREHTPDLPVVLMTGYPLDPEADLPFGRDHIEILEKPITLQRLAQRVNQVLGSAVSLVNNR
jgi:CheY-like chemotaxis protein